MGGRASAARVGGARPGRAAARRPAAGTVLTVLMVLMVLTVLSVQGPMTVLAPDSSWLAPDRAAAASTSGPQPVDDPASMVDAFAGTGTGSTRPGSIGEFPGADTPFGMVQWSPDTTPHRLTGSGYSYGDHRISGFSLTHLSGTGCASYGDVPILPTVGDPGRDPSTDSDSFTHRQESASPGRYQVRLGPAGIDAQLAATTRTGLARFRFPRTRWANVLFKVGDSAAGASGAGVQVTGDNEVDGHVTSGQFCQTGTDYTLYFAARFDHPFRTAATFAAATSAAGTSAAGTSATSPVAPGTRQCEGPTCGAVVTFDTTSDPVVLLKVGISFVSQADAAANLAAEDPGWSLARVEAAATARWNAVLRRVAVGGGTTAQQRTFYTALYHSLLHPNVVSDVDGRYAGEDGRVHTVAPGRAQYANFSEWDIYRSEIALVSVVAPGSAGDMVQSLVDDADQAGWLPKWAIVGGDASQMNGDSADPIIASAYAFGVRGFDVPAALAAMVKGADQAESPQGLEIERQYLAQYLSQHYVDGGVLDLDSIDYSMGASATLEYAIDDFAIARLAAATGDAALAATMDQRAHNWEYLFNPATGSVQARQDDGSFPPGPAFNPALFEAGGQQGFEEGNAAQYTWSVPQDLGTLADLMGGDAVAVSRLDRFFGRLNAGRFAPYDWAGNEPSLWTPWEYDWFGDPSGTQATVRRIADTLYRDAPVNEPGNDDLGAISSWYVWAALGLYPVTPGTATLALASPLFPLVDVTLPDGRHLVEHAPAAAASAPYVHALRIDGTPRTTPWLPASVVRTGASLDYDLSSTADPLWGTARAARPPSYPAGRLTSIGYSVPSGRVTVRIGVPTTVEIGVRQLPGAPAVKVALSTTGAIAASPGPGVAGAGVAGAGVLGAGVLGAGVPATSGAAAVDRHVPVTLVASSPGPGALTVTLTQAGVAPLPVPPVVVDVDAIS